MFYFDGANIGHVFLCSVVVLVVVLFLVDALVEIATPYQHFSADTGLFVSRESIYLFCVFVFVLAAI